MAIIATIFLTIFTSDFLSCIFENISCFFEPLSTGFPPITIQYHTRNQLSRQTEIDNSVEITYVKNLPTTFVSRFLRILEIVYPIKCLILLLQIPILHLTQSGITLQSGLHFQLYIGLQKYHAHQSVHLLLAHIIHTIYRIAQMKKYE
ncbi:hypothetical protein D9M71_560710 [compost metagenome]